MKYEQFSVGQTFQTIPVVMKKEEIMTFASQYDPQYFHIDEERQHKAIMGELMRLVPYDLKGMGRVY